MYQYEKEIDDEIKSRMRIKAILVEEGIPEDISIGVNLYKRGHPHLKGETFINRESFLVNVYKGSHKDGEDPIATLRHELRHVKQVLDGRLVTNTSGGLSFEGVDIKDGVEPHEEDLVDKQ